MFTDLVNIPYNYVQLRMRISYQDRSLEKLCLQQRIAQKKLGNPCATKLRNRIADLDAADNPTVLPAGKPHPLKGDRAGQFSVSLANGICLCFEPQENPPPKKQDGGIDWRQVTSIVIVFIGDYHD